MGWLCWLEYDNDDDSNRDDNVSDNDDDSNNDDNQDDDSTW